MNGRTFTKRVVGAAAEIRLEKEIAAYADAERFWTARVPGWASPRLVAAHRADRVLELSVAAGVACTFEDWAFLAERLLGAVAFTANRPWGAPAPLPASLPAGPASAALGSWWGAARPALLRVQGDLRPENVLRDGDVLTLVDWELSREGAVAEDLGSFVAHACIAERRGRAARGTAQALLEMTRGTLPSEAAAALAIADLRLQASRERALDNLEGAALREAIAAELSERWSRC